MTVLSPFPSFRIVLLAGIVLALPGRASALPHVPWEDDPAAALPHVPTAAEDKTAVTYREDDTWHAIDFDAQKIAKGSALDFSRFLDAPAGKHGEVVCRDGVFQFKDAPGKPVRFYGIDLSMEANFPPDKAHAEQMADSLAAAGFNAVRIHLFDFMLAPDAGSAKFDEARRDQLNCLISCLRQRGIYYTIELYMERGFKAGLVDGYAGDIRDEAMPLMPLSDPLAQSMEEYARNLLFTPNAYTGLALKDDPALISIEFLNEDALFMRYHRLPALEQFYQDKFQAWLAGQGKAALAGPERDAAFCAWVVGLQRKIYTTLADYLHGQGVQKPFTDLTIRFSYAETLSRVLFDYVDVHSYLALATGLGPKKYLEPYEQNFTDCVTARLREPLRVAPSRIFGKPFACGEFSVEIPHPTRNFTVPETATLAGLQDWSAIYYYTYSHEHDTIFREHKAIRYDAVTDPGVMISQRIGALLFAQGAVRPSEVKVPFVVTPEYCYSQIKPKAGVEYPVEYAELGAYCQIGTVMLDKDTDLSGYPCVVVPADMKLPPAVAKVKHAVADGTLWKQLGKTLPGLDPNHIVATTGQVDADFGAGVLKTVTPQAESFVCAKPVAAADGDTVGIRDNDAASVAFAGSLDGRKLSESDRILVLYLTEVQNSGTVIGFGEKNRGVLYDDGKLPRMGRQGQAEFLFKAKGRTLPRVWALNYDGSRGDEVAPRKTDDGFAFTARAVTGRQSYFAYEVAWE